jgi:hypothetical protein
VQERYLYYIFQTLHYNEFFWTPARGLSRGGTSVLVVAVNSTIDSLYAPATPGNTAVCGYVRYTPLLDYSIAPSSLYRVYYLYLQLLQYRVWSLRVPYRAQRSE